MEFLVYGVALFEAISGMGIFRRSSRYSSQTENDFSLWQKLREDFSQSSELVERMAAWIGDSRGRIALFGAITILAVVIFMLISILLFGAPKGVDKEFVPVGASAIVPSGTVGAAAEVLA